MRVVREARLPGRVLPHRRTVLTGPPPAGPSRVVQRRMIEHPGGQWDTQSPTNCKSPVGLPVFGRGRSRP